MKKHFLLTLSLLLTLPAVSIHAARDPEPAESILDSLELLIAGSDGYPAFVRDASADSVLVDSVVAIFHAEHLPCEEQCGNHKENKALALGYLKEIAETPGLDANAEAAVDNRLALYHQRNDSGRSELYILYLAKAAIAGLREGHTDIDALYRIGTQLALDGDYKRASRILRLAAGADGDTRMTDDCRNMAVMAEKAAQMRKRHAVFASAAAVAVCTLAALCIFLILRMRHTRLRNMSAHTKMQDNRRTKELYIQQFLNLCMLYTERLEYFNLLVARKLKAGQVQDLYSNIESGKYVREQTEKFYEAFDEAVLKIYPLFIDELNGLLLPERRVSLAPGRRLTPELRIAAFSRLGITDSSKVSQFLGLSLNTVYTYRNRLRSRAANRDTFEDDLMKIGDGNAPAKG